MASSGQKSFKSTAFGGFDKQDVMQYIERSAKERRETERALIAERDRLLREAEELRMELGARSAAKLSEETALADSVVEKDTRIEELTKENIALKEEHDRVMGEAVERAERRAQEIEDEAKQNANLVRETLVRLVGETRARYARMRDDTQTAIDSVISELSNVSALGIALSNTFDDVNADLDKLNFAGRPAVPTPEQTDKYTTDMDADPTPCADEAAEAAQPADAFETAGFADAANPDEGEMADMVSAVPPAGWQNELALTVADALYEMEQEGDSPATPFHT